MSENNDENKQRFVILVLLFFVVCIPVLLTAKYGIGCGIIYLISISMFCYSVTKMYDNI